MENDWNKTLELTVPPELDGERLDRALAALAPDFSRAALQKMIRDGKVSAANGTVWNTPRQTVRAGLTLCVAVPPPISARPSAEPFAFPILYEDDAMLVIDKPAGVVVHPAAGNPDGTVVNALLSRYPQLAEHLEEFDNRPGIVHRLDKDTSGCLVIAKNAHAHSKLAASFAAHDVRKTYLALVRGNVREPSGKLETLIGRHPVNRQKMAVVRRNGKEAVTLWKRRFCGELGRCAYSLLEVDILTGRTHQIRVHTSSMGHPVLGDTLYGGASPEIPAARQLLHAWKIRIPHPDRQELVECTAPIPDDMKGWLPEDV